MGGPQERRTPRDRADALARAARPETFTRGTLRVRIASARLLDNGVLEVRVAEAFDGASALPIDDRYLFVNPPLMVPTGTRHVEHDDAGKPFEVVEFREDHGAAFRVIVADAVRHYAERGRPGNVTLTVFADASDGFVHSIDALYSNAREGLVFKGGGTATTFSPPGQEFDGTLHTVRQTFESFDTSSIPDTATIDSATLSLYGQSNPTIVAFTVQARGKDWGATLETADFHAGSALSSLPLLATFATSGWILTSYNVFTSQAAFLTHINKTGATRMVICSSRQAAGDVPTGNETVGYFLAEASGTTQDPKLVVNYTPVQVANLVRASEADTARAVTTRSRSAAGVAAESEPARSLATRKTYVLGRATNSEAARAMATTKRTSIGRAIATETARALLLGRDMLRAVATETARVLASRKTYTIGRATSTESGRAVATVVAATRRHDAPPTRAAVVSRASSVGGGSGRRRVVGGSSKTGAKL